MCAPKRGRRGFLLSSREERIEVRRDLKLVLTKRSLSKGKKNVWRKIHLIQDSASHKPIERQHWVQRHAGQATLHGVSKLALRGGASVTLAVNYFY